MLPRRRDLLALFSLTLPAPAATALAEPHFPSRLHLFIWRNWELANSDRIARVIGATGSKVLELGRSLGLPRKPLLTADQLRRIYITVIRQNWHVIPNSQIVQLLGWNDRRLEFTLKEDDFLDVKLQSKAALEPLVWHEPTANERTRAAETRAIVAEVFGQELHAPGEAPFAFVDRLSRPTGRPPAPVTGKAVWNPRYLYSYFALYGDPLMEPASDPFPEGLLERLSATGINGVWMQAVLNTLAPSKAFPEFGSGWETRLRTLNTMVARAARHGVKIFLYLNEPRSMSAEFFERHPDTRGSSFQKLWSMCTSTEPVRDWLAGSLEHVFRRVPGLGGVFTISMSENHTNCFSHGGAWRVAAPTAGDCPRCTKRPADEALAEMFAAMHKGIRAASADATIIHWDWGWPDQLAERLIPRLDKDVMYSSISEWSKPVERGGVKTKVGEYSISVTGPGPRALRNWRIARDAGLRTIAKVQFNNTWEISAVPYIPVPHLVLEHCEGLEREGISGLQASWTCGGYPSPNLQAARYFFYSPRPSREEILLRVATARYGAQRAPQVVEAWRIFSEAFTEFPYGVQVYLIPTQHGPANLLRLEPTGQAPGMILFPHDALKAWCGPYPPEVVLSQFTKLATRWREGLTLLERAAPQATEDLDVARTCYHHFLSVAHQVEFYLRRGGDSQRLRQLAEAEIELARLQYPVARRNSTIAYEATNHYYYRPLDLVEKVLNCRHLIGQLR